MDKLAVIVLGNENAGKSTTWEKLFGVGRKGVHTGKNERDLDLGVGGESAKVFLINGSPQETGKEVEDRVGNQSPDIVLCSVQYVPDALNTIDYLIGKGYHIYCQWLNPGHQDVDAQVYDSLGLTNYLLSKNMTLTIQSGKDDPAWRVKLIRRFIYGWVCVQ